MIKVELHTYYRSVEAGTKRTFLVVDVIEPMVKGDSGKVRLLEWGKGKQLIQSSLNLFKEQIANGLLQNFEPNPNNYQYNQ